jgi:hypothetical protein
MAKMMSTPMKAAASATLLSFVEKGGGCFSAWLRRPLHRRGDKSEHIHLNEPVSVTAIA